MRVFAYITSGFAMLRKHEIRYAHENMAESVREFGPETNLGELRYWFDNQRVDSLHRSADCIYYGVYRPVKNRFVIPPDSWIKREPREAIWECSVDTKFNT